jgi:CDP-diacylglycerol---serine O-phosphatidyltransferase
MAQRKSAALVQTIPNLVTCIGLSCGLISIFMSMAGNYAQAAWFIALCVLLDKLDGTTARLLNAGSEIGVQLDSLSDFVTFTVAPAMLYVAILTQQGTVFSTMPRSLLIYTSAVVYVIAGAARLARFNCEAQDGGIQRFFQGIPTTVVGAFAAMFYLVISKYVPLDSYAAALPPLLLLLAISMVCGLYLPKLGKTGSKMVNLFFVLNTPTVIGCVVFQLCPEYLLSILVIYLSVGLIWANRKGVEIS